MLLQTNKAANLITRFCNRVSAVLSVHHRTYKSF